MASPMRVVVDRFATKLVAALVSHMLELPRLAAAQAGKVLSPNSGTAYELMHRQMMEMQTKFIGKPAFSRHVSRV